MSRKYDVNIMISRIGDIYTDCSYNIKSEPMTEAKIKDYLATLSCNEKIPENSCVLRMFANMCIDTTIFVSNTAPDNKHINRYDGRLNICPILKRTSICTAKNCARKIKNGKCTDPFVIENIGKKFFAYKYKKEQTKQR